MQSSSRCKRWTERPELERRREGRRRRRRRRALWVSAARLWCLSDGRGRTQRDDLEVRPTRHFLRFRRANATHANGCKSITLLGRRSQTLTGDHKARKAREDGFKNQNLPAKEWSLPAATPARGGTDLFEAVEYTADSRHHIPSWLSQGFHLPGHPSLTDLGRRKAFAVWVRMDARYGAVAQRPDHIAGS